MSGQTPLRLFRTADRSPAPKSNSTYATGQVYELVPLRIEQKVSTRKRVYDAVTLSVHGDNGEQLGEIEAPAEFGILAVTAVHCGYGEMGRKFPAVCITPWDRGNPVFAAVRDEKYIDPGPLLGSGG